MSKRREGHQPELPNTRRADEGPPPAPFKPIKALDDNIAAWQNALARRKKVNQEIVAFQREQQELLVKHDRPTYPYESKGGGERELYRNERVSSRKTKTKPEAEVKGKRGKKSKEGDAGEEKESAEG